MYTVPHRVAPRDDSRFIVAMRDIRARNKARRRRRRLTRRRRRCPGAARPCARRLGAFPPPRYICININPARKVHIHTYVQHTHNERRDAMIDDRICQQVLHAIAGTRTAPTPDATSGTLFRGAFRRVELLFSSSDFCDEAATYEILLDLIFVNLQFREWFRPETPKVRGCPSRRDLRDLISLFLDFYFIFSVVKYINVSVYLPADQTRIFYR